MYIPEPAAFHMTLAKENKEFYEYTLKSFQPPQSSQKGAPSLPIVLLSVTFVLALITLNALYLLPLLIF